jgi:hypothetical protein
VPLTITLKYEVANLRLLQEWFIDQLTSRAHLVDGIPDSLSLSLCHDVGLYLGETVRQELPQLKWTLRTLRRDDLYFQHSVLSGFSDPQKCIDFFFVLTRGLNLVIQGKGFPEKHQFDFMIKTIINHERNPFY